MSNIFTIMKKELKRFFTDRRMLISLIMPGLIIFIIYTLIGSFISEGMNVDSEYTYNVYVENIPEEYKDILDESEYKINYIDEDKTIDEIRADISEKEADLYLGFEEDFNNKLENNLLPNVTIYYNSSSPESSELYNYLYTNLYGSSVNVSFNFLVNANANEKYDLATNEDVSAMIITMILPFYY